MLPVPQGNALYEMALTFVPNVGDKLARALVAHFGSAEGVFKASVKELFSVPGMGQLRARSVREASVFRRAEAEIDFAARNDIDLIFSHDPAYPDKLRQCADAPLLLYAKGKLPAQDTRTVAVIGTRRNTDYGLQLCEELVDGCRGQNITIVSGLARGIDAIAHKRCLQSGVPTVGVLGHGLDHMYPAAHRTLARDMLAEGGAMVTEFPSGTGPDRVNFPVRNRIVAGMCDVTVVVESDAKGGAMITAYLAHGYNREVAAFPGRTGDIRSSGCNLLIRRNIAALISNAGDLMDLMNWAPRKKARPPAAQLQLGFSGEERLLVDLLSNRDRVHVDELLLCSGLNATQIAATLLQLELQGVVRSLAGKYYRLQSYGA